MARMTTQGIKAAGTHWWGYATIAAGAVWSLTNDRVLQAISSSGGFARIEHRVEDGSTWVEAQDRVGTLRPTGVSTPLVIPQLGIDTTAIRVRNSGGVGDDIMVKGWAVE